MNQTSIKRCLFVVSAEWDMVRRTGLNEMSQLPKHVGSLWDDSHCVLPQFQSHSKEQCAIANFSSGEKWRKFVPITSGMQPEIHCGKNRCRIHGELPADESTWNQFCSGALKMIEALAKNRPIDVMAVDWPTSKLVELLRRNRDIHSQVVFTVDLVPCDSRAKSMWNRGVKYCHKLHIPSDKWQSHISNDIKSASKSVLKHTSPFGLELAAFDIIKKRHEKSVLVNEINRVHDRQWSDSDMLFVCRNRWTVDDQKNFSLIFETLTPFLNWAKNTGHQPRFMIGPLNWNKPVEEFLYSTNERYSQMINAESVIIESQDEIKIRHWESLLKAADVQLIPSKFEPCGLNHAQGMNFGVIPICTSEGVMGEYPMEDKKNCFLFHWRSSNKSRSADVFLEKIKEASTLYYGQSKTWSAMVSRAKSAAQFYDLKVRAREYKNLIFGE